MQTSSRDRWGKGPYTWNHIRKEAVRSFEMSYCQCLWLPESDLFSLIGCTNCFGYGYMPIDMEALTC